jgi:hypothetical protein
VIAIDFLEEAMRKVLNDPEFHKKYLKRIGDDADPLMMPEELTKAIREMPRDAGVIDLLEKMAGAGPLPPR